MCGNGVMTVMEVTAVHLRRIRKVQAAARTEFAVAAAGATTLGSVVSPIVADTLQTASTTIRAFVSVIEFFLQETLTRTLLRSGGIGHSVVYHFVG